MNDSNQCPAADSHQDCPCGCGMCVRCDGITPPASRTEWSVEFYLFQPGNHAAPMKEAEARKWAANHPKHARVVSRTVTESPWRVEQ